MMTADLKMPWLKTIGWAVLIHIILITLSILEVVIYSIIINPGQEQSFYEQHAQITAPYISIIFGIILFFFISRFLIKKQYDNRKIIGLALPFAYIIMDVIILLFADTDWGQQYLTFLISFTTKTFAAYLGAISRKKTV